MKDLNRRTFLGRSAGGILGAAAGSSLPWVVASRTAVAWDESIDPSKASLIYRSTMPRNGEPRLDKLAEDWITPTSQFYVRSHAANPEIVAGEFRVTVEGMVKTPLTFSVSELVRIFPASSCTCTVSCAGLRRYEHSKTRPVGGVQWEEGPIGNAHWTGVRLSDVLKRAGVSSAAKHVWFEGADEVEGTASSYPFGGSVPLTKLQEEDDAMPGVLLATHMNGQPLLPDHGFPIRALVPGYIGARSVKWLRRIVLSDASSPNHFVADAYKIVESGTPIEWDEAAPIYRYPVNAALCSAVQQDGKLNLKGYALPAGHKGCFIAKVEFSVDGGQSWSAATLGKQVGEFCWQLWEATLTNADPGSEICVRATDSRGNVMPETVPWNPKGYLYNAWHRIPVSQLLK